MNEKTCHFCRAILPPDFLPDPINFGDGLSVDIGSHRGPRPEACNPCRERVGGLMNSFYGMITGSTQHHEKIK